MSYYSYVFNVRLKVKYLMGSCDYVYNRKGRTFLGYYNKRMFVRRERLRRSAWCLRQIDVIYLYLAAPS